MDFLTKQEINDSMELDLALDVFKLMEEGVDQESAISIVNNDVLRCMIYDPIIN